MKIMKRNRRNWKQERRHKKNSMLKWQQLSNGHLIRILKVHQINQSIIVYAGRNQTEEEFMMMIAQNESAKEEVHRKKVERLKQ